MVQTSGKEFDARGAQLVQLTTLNDRLESIKFRLDRLPASSSLEPAFRAELQQIGETLESLELVGAKDKFDDLIGELSDNQSAISALTNTEFREEISEKIDQTRDLREKAQQQSDAAARILGQMPAQIQRIVDGISNGEMRSVALIDDQRGIVFIANNSETLARVIDLAMPAASPGVLERHTGGRAADRIRFFATGDGVVQW
jgi:ABC-type transporter Mla subunit MlaD